MKVRARAEEKKFWKVRRREKEMEPGKASGRSDVKSLADTLSTGWVRGGGGAKRKLRKHAVVWKEAFETFLWQPERTHENACRQNVPINTFKFGISRVVPCKHMSVCPHKHKCPQNSGM